VSRPRLLSARAAMGVVYQGKLWLSNGYYRGNILS
jgi:hypothetical protein